MTQMFDLKTAHYSQHVNMVKEISNVFLDKTDHIESQCLCTI